MLSARTKGNPVAVAIAIVAAVISIGQVSYEDYFAGAQFIHFLLGTATVSLAVPIYRGVASLKGRALPLLVALFYGGGTSILTAVGLARLLGGDAQIVRAMYAKSVTAPIGMGIAERIGAAPTLTAVFAVTTGILGAILAPFVLNALRIVPGWQRGFSAGLAAHGLGTSRAFQVAQENGMFASLAMGLHGILGALLIPLLARL
ncbi:MAG: LrgB family protein [Candidatus Protistobacter heckmanni]|nr:LrgB family protein [Candidatus Protistobacter heckmanni]